MVRELHRNRRAAGLIPDRDLKLYFSLLFLVNRSNKCIQLFQLRLSPEQSENVEYERESTEEVHTEISLQVNFA